MDRHQRMYDRQRARPVEFEYRDGSGIDGDTEGVEAVVSNLPTHGESRYRIELSVKVKEGDYITIWRDALPRFACGQPGIFRYYSPASLKDQSQLVVKADEMSRQQLWVEVYVMHAEGTKVTYMQPTELNNTARGGTTELVHLFDHDALKLHIYVPPNLVQTR